MKISENCRYMRVNMRNMRLWTKTSKYAKICGIKLAYFDSPSSNSWIYLGPHTFRSTKKNMYLHEVPSPDYYRHQCRYLVGLLIFFASLFYIKIFFFSLLLSVSCWAIDCICCCCVDLQRRRVAFKHTLIVYWFKNKKFTSPSVDQRKVHWCPFSLHRQFQRVRCSRDRLPLTQNKKKKKKINDFTLGPAVRILLLSAASSGAICGRRRQLRNGRWSRAALNVVY